MEKNTVLKLENISKQYPGVLALDHLNIAFQEGEIHALLGENGAGKSTLIKVCTGAVRPSSGTIEINGRQYSQITPQLSEENGVAVVYQELNLVNELSVAENIYLGQKIGAKHIFNKSVIEQKADELLSRLGMNYGGDNMNFQMACDEVEIDGIQTEIVTAADDVASALSENAQKRRGVAGLIYAYKIAGAAADEMMNLQEVADITRKALNNIRSMGIALSPCIVPEVGVTTFTIGEDEVEIGMWIHGEKGIEVHKMMTADELAAVMLEKIVSDNPLENGDEVSVLVNGLGATPLEEQMIFYRAVHKLLDNRGVSVVLPHIGEYATSMEMAGLSLTVFKLDDQLKRLLKAPASTPFYNFS